MFTEIGIIRELASGNVLKDYLPQLERLLDVIVDKN